MINPITVVGVLGQLAGIVHKKHEEHAVQGSGTKANTPNQQYDVKNMSLDELKTMAMNLFNSGSINDKDYQNLSTQINSIQQTTGLSSNTKVDMLALFQQQLQQAKTAGKNSDALNDAFNILNGVQARLGANIPSHI